MGILKNYDLDELQEIREVVADRLDDYGNHVLEEYEEEYKGQMSKEPNLYKCYEFGYGDKLNSAVHLIDDLIAEKRKEN